MDSDWPVATELYKSPLILREPPLILWVSVRHRGKMCWIEYFASRIYVCLWTAVDPMIVPWLGKIEDRRKLTDVGEAMPTGRRRVSWPDLSSQLWSHQKILLFILFNFPVNVKETFLTKIYKWYVYNSQTITHTFYWIQAQFVHFTEQVSSSGNTRLMTGNRHWYLRWPLYVWCWVKQDNHCVYIEEQQKSVSPVRFSQVQGEHLVGPCGCHLARLGGPIGK